MDIDDELILKARKSYDCKKYKAKKLFNYSERKDEKNHNKLAKYQVNDNTSAAKDLLEKQGICFDSRPMGAGKTELMVKIVQEAEAKGLKVGYIAHRVALLANSCKRLGIDNYEHLNWQMMPKVKSMGVCVNSIIKPHFSNFYNSADIILIDEIKQVLENVGVGCVDKRYKSQIFEFLKEIISNAKLVIVADADLDDKTLDFVISTIKDKDKKTEVHYLTSSATKNKKRVLFSDYDHVWDEAIKSILAGVETLIQCDTLQETQTIQKRIEKEVKKRGLKGLMINADNSGDIDQSNFLTDPNSLCKKYKYLIHSPVIGSGVSIEKNHFKKHYVLMSGVISPTDITQTIGRNRPSTEIIIGFRERISTGIKEESADQIYIDSVMAENNYEVKIIDGERYIKYESTAFDSFCYEIIAQNNAAMNDYINNTLLILKEKGYSIVRVDNIGSPEAISEHKKASRDAKEDHIKNVLLKPIISDLEAEKLQRQKIGQEESYLLERFNVTKTLSICEITEDDVLFYDGGKGLYKIKNMEIALASKEDCKNFDLREKKAVSSEFNRSKTLAKNKFLALVFNNLNIDMQTGEGVVSQDDAFKLIRKLHKSSERYNGLGFGNFSNFNKVSVIKKVNFIFRQLGLQLIAAENDRKNRDYKMDQKRWQQIMLYTNNRKAWGRSYFMADEPIEGLKHV